MRRVKCGKAVTAKVFDLKLTALPHTSVKMICEGVVNFQKRLDGIETFHFSLDEAEGFTNTTDFEVIDTTDMQATVMETRNKAVSQIELQAVKVDVISSRPALQKQLEDRNILIRGTEPHRITNPDESLDLKSLVRNYSSTE